MSITLGGITISDNMYLDGIENASLASLQSERTVDGLSLTAAKATPGGRLLTLGSVVDSSIMGIWCQSVIDEIKAIEAVPQVIELNYHGDTYNVIIESVDFTQLFKFEPVTENKKYTGQVTLKEV